MIPDLNEYNIFSIRVYEADPLKGEKHEEGKRLESSNYEILDLSRNGIYGNKKQYGVPNHMQAMTVAPVKDGVVDYSQLTIAYAGADKESLYTKPVEKLNE